MNLLRLHAESAAEPGRDYRCPESWSSSSTQGAVTTIKNHAIGMLEQGLIKRWQLSGLLLDPMHPTALSLSVCTYVCVCCELKALEL